MKTELKLNDRQIDLYNYLVLRSGKPITLKNLCCEMSEKHDEYKINPNITFNNTSARRLMTRDIQIINKSDDLDKVIVNCNRNGIGLAEKDRIEERLQRELIQLKARIKRFNIKKAKFERNNQMKIALDGERDVREAYL